MKTTWLIRDNENEDFNNGCKNRLLSALRCTTMKKIILRNNLALIIVQIFGSEKKKREKSMIFVFVEFSPSVKHS